MLWAGNVKKSLIFCFRCYGNVRICPLFQFYEDFWWGGLGLTENYVKERVEKEMTYRKSVSKGWSNFGYQSSSKAQKQFGKILRPKTKFRKNSKAILEPFEPGKKIRKNLKKIMELKKLKETIFIVYTQILFLLTIVYTVSSALAPNLVFWTRRKYWKQIIWLIVFPRGRRLFITTGITLPYNLVFLFSSIHNSFSFLIVNTFVCNGYPFTHP